MAIIRCSSCGFFYDEEKYGACPKCSGAYRAGRAEESVLVIGGAVKAGADAFIQTGETGFLAGWLVCVRGPQRGRDFRIFPGFNRIGRQTYSDICLEDALVARENHCSVVYEPKRGKFFLVPGMGTVTFKNGKRIDGAEPLEEGDVIGLGESLLAFVPFGWKEYTWETWSIRARARRAWNRWS